MVGASKNSVVAEIDMHLCTINATAAASYLSIMTENRKKALTHQKVTKFLYEYH